MSKIASRTNTMGLTGRRLRWAITATSVIGFSLFGYGKSAPSPLGGHCFSFSCRVSGTRGARDQGLMSGIITGVKFNEEFPATAGTSHRATVIQGAVTSCYELGCFFGAVFTLLRGERDWSTTSHARRCRADDHRNGHLGDPIQRTLGSRPNSSSDESSLDLETE
ncbi:hypothetical protein L1887_55056 [Cichorium endivia]|nr:hypothetical protein L1887_55056 [Cichorium endivia]